MSRSALLLGVSLFAVASPATAQQSSGQQRPSVDSEEIVVTGELERFGATKSDTPILETARSISIETERDFRDKGFETLDDALAYTAGVTAETYGFDMRGDFATIRGLGVPEYRDNLQYLFGFYNNPRPDLYLAEQVEVLKGPTSVLYGAGSPGGIVNVVTKRPFDGSLFEVRGRVGNFDRYEAMTDFNTAIPGTGDTGFFRFTGLYRNTGTQIDQVDEEKIVIAPSFSAQPTASTTITLLTNYTSQKTDTGHQFLPLEGTLLPHVSGREIDPLAYFGKPGFNRYDSESVTITLIAEQGLAEGLNLEAVGRYSASNAIYNQAWPAFLAVGVPRIDAEGDAAWTFYASDARSEALATDARLRWEFTTGGIEHQVLGGVQYQDVMTDNDSAYIFNGGTINVFDPTYEDAPTEAEIAAAFFRAPSNFVESTGLYINDQVIAGPFIVTGGVRFDWVTNRTGRATPQKDSATSFSGGVLYRGPFGLSPYVSYAESFQPVLGIDRDTLEAFEPQKGRQYEAGLKWQIPDTRSFVTMAAFDIEQSNLPNPQALPGGGGQQLGISKIRGVEVEGNLAIGGLLVDANYSFLDHENPNGFRLASIPRHQASLFATYRFAGALDGFRLGGGVRYQGKNESSGFNGVGTAAPGTPLIIAVDGHTVADASIGYRWGNWDLSVNARNVTDEQYFTTCLARGDCYPNERRTVIATVGYRM